MKILFSMKKKILNYFYRKENVCPTQELAVSCISPANR